MGQTIMDRLHRAAKRFGEELGDAKEIRKLRDALMRAGTKSESLRGVYFDVTIDEEWIARIERAIPHLEAAIREDRQFIKTEGNITSIERVRKVSRSSVEHLARHSEMITHVPEEGQDLIPDKLQVFENESNYDVYENRVLYMVLCSTRDFLDYRYSRIAKAWNEKSVETECQKTIRTAGGKLSFDLKLSDMTGGLTAEEDATAHKIVRIEAAAGAIMGLLATPLMKIVALAPMVTPPITRTNVLRMDQHFKAVVELYDYLSTYDGDGFTLERHENTLTPFPEQMESEVSELALFAMYLNHKYGKNAADELEANFAAEEAARREAEEKARAEKLEQIRARLSGGDVTVEECLQLLGEETTAFESSLQELREELERAAEWKKSAETATIREEALRKTLDDQRRISSDMNRHAAMQTEEARAEIERLKAEADELRLALANEQEQRRFLSARIVGMTEAYGAGTVSADYSEREDFIELEKEREAFERVYSLNWKKAKKKIRKRLLWGKEEVNNE
ncbi:MAG: DUF2357 domain-containing protein [Lachnospiraceae bacterium]|nr:DUF2357 domain-containing protein [Lachnospiraceae bacterium]